MNTRAFRINAFRLSLCRIDRAIRAGRPFDESLISEAQERAADAGMYSAHGYLSSLAGEWKDVRPLAAAYWIRHMKAYAAVQAQFANR
jgi:hypothetical protein